MGATTSDHFCRPRSSTPILSRRLPIPSLEIVRYRALPRRMPNPRLNIKLKQRIEDQWSRFPATNTSASWRQCIMFSHRVPAWVQLWTLPTSLQKTMTGRQIRTRNSSGYNLKIMANNWKNRRKQVQIWTNHGRRRKMPGREAVQRKAYKSRTIDTLTNNQRLNSTIRTNWRGRPRSRRMDPTSLAKVPISASIWPSIQRNLRGVSRGIIFWRARTRLCLSIRGRGIWCFRMKKSQGTGSFIAR